MRHYPSCPGSGGLHIHTAPIPPLRLAGVLGNAVAVGIHVANSEICAGYGPGLRAKIAPLTQQIRIVDGGDFHVPAQCFSWALVDTDPLLVHPRNVVGSPRGAHFRGLQVMHICFARAGIADRTSLCESTQIVLSMRIAEPGRSLEVAQPVWEILSTIQTVFQHHAKVALGPSVALARGLLQPRP